MRTRHVSYFWAFWVQRPRLAGRRLHFGCLKTLKQGLQMTTRGLATERRHSKHPTQFEVSMRPQSIKIPRGSNTWLDVQGMPSPRAGAMNGSGCQNSFLYQRVVNPSKGRVQRATHVFMLTQKNNSLVDLGGCPCEDLCHLRREQPPNRTG